MSSLSPIEIFLASRNGLHAGDRYQNDVYFQLPRSIVTPEGYGMYLQLISFTCPVSWHVVNSRNNRLTVNGAAYTVPPGNYSAASLCSALNATLPVAVSYSVVTMKMTLSAEAPFTLDGSMCAQLLGIAPGTTGETVSSRDTIDLTGTNSVFVMTNFQSSNDNIDSRGDTGSVICRVSVAVPPGSVIQYQDFAGRSGLALDDDVLAAVHIRLEDEDRVMLRATLSWEMTLQVSFVSNGRSRMQADRPLGLRAPPGA